MGFVCRFRRAWFVRTAILISLILSSVLQPSAVSGQDSTARDRAGAAAIHGLITDATNEGPLAAAEVRLRELGRQEISHEDGTFRFNRLAAGRYTLVVQRVGYATTEISVVVVGADTAHVQLALEPSGVRLPGIVVTGAGRERELAAAYQPTAVLTDAELRRRLGSSVAATLEHEPGISIRYNGPAAAQPVIRGLSGERILVLEDGQRTGDIATTAPDHAVTIDPLTAERIEVIRGPAGLLYGSNTLGGVINVIRDEVPRTRPEHWSGTASVQAESVNRGVTGGTALLLPLGGFVLRGEASGRTAGDTRTPLGRLHSSGLDGHSIGAGVSRIGDRGYIGAAVRDLGMRYGVPGEFDGVVIPGAHAGGVEIELSRTAYRIEAGLLDGVGPFDAIEAELIQTSFLQTEYEAGGTVGSQFGQVALGGDLVARHDHTGARIGGEGAVGVSFYHKDLNADGLYTGTRPANQLTLAAYAYEEVRFGRLRAQVGLRYDRSRITPRDSTSRVLGPIGPRTFDAVSGSAAMLFDIRPGVTAGATLARAHRSPSIEELFSDGPHLADFSFNIGSPELPAESGTGTDLFLRIAQRRLSGEVAVFHQVIRHYIHYAPTGELDPRFRRFPVYQARSTDARLWGGEAGVEWEVLPRWVVAGTVGYVRGRRVDTGEPLPAMPPLDGSLRVRYDAPSGFIGVGWRGAAAQSRVSEFEEPTAGYHLMQGEAGVRRVIGGRLHTLTITAENLGDRVWRDHLSRIKAVAPQPGRNIRVLYRVAF